MKKLSLIKTHGGKFYLASWIISLFPKNYEQLTYVESHTGGANIFLQKKPSLKEVLNDLYYPTYCLLKQVRDNTPILLQHLKSQFYTESLFNYWLQLNSNNERIIAQKEIILRRWSRGGLKKSFAWSKRLRGGIPGDENAWKNFLSNFLVIASRFQKSDLTIHNEDAIICMSRYDTPDTLAYCDPPYLHETRTSKGAYDIEMTDKQHEELLDFCCSAKSKILISGYSSKLYDDKLSNWNQFYKEVKNNSGQNSKKQKRIEWLWRNY